MTHRRRGGPRAKHSVAANLEVPVDDFPVDRMQALQRSVHASSWTVPVVPDGDLADCVAKATEVVKQGRLTQSEPCQQFLVEGLVHDCYDKLLNSTAVAGWSRDIHGKIFQLLASFLALFLAVIRSSEPAAVRATIAMGPMFAAALDHRCEFHKATRYRDQTGQRKDDPTYSAPQHEWLRQLVQHFSDRLCGLQVLILRGSRSGDTRLLAPYLR